jgi:hypothetical protein
MGDPLQSHIKARVELGVALLAYPTMMFVPPHGRLLTVFVPIYASVS